MPGTSYSSGSALEIAERRASVRTLVTPPIYVNLDNLNGGLVFNISEDGLGLTAALYLADAGFLTMRILLPDSDGWIEASGEIAWRGNSRKEGGIRFVGLGEEARRRISNWIAAEASNWEFPEKKEAGAPFVGVAEDTHQRVKNWAASETPPLEFTAGGETRIQTRDWRENARQRLRAWIFQGKSRGEISLPQGNFLEKDPCVVDIASVRPSNSALLEFTNSEAIAEEQSASTLADSEACLETKLALVKPNLQLPPAEPDNFEPAGSAPEAADRRVQTRTRINLPIYVSIDNVNGGLAFNVSEDGLALTTARTIVGDRTMSLRIQIPHSEGWVEARGRVAWRSESGKTAGITFVGMPEAARRRIRDWLVTETLEGELPPGESTLLKPGLRPADEIVAEKPVAFLPEILNANSAVEKRMLDAILSGGRLASTRAWTQISTTRQEPSRELQQQTLRIPDSPAEHAEITALAAVSSASPWQFSKSNEFEPRSTPAFPRITSGTRTGKLRRLGAVMTLAGATAAGIGWIATHPGVRNEVTISVAQNTGGTTKPTELKTARPWNKTKNDLVVRPENSHTQIRDIEPVPAHGRATDSGTRSAPTRPQPREIDRPASRPTGNGTHSRTEESLPKTQPANIPQRAVAGAPIPVIGNTRNQVAENPAAHPMEGSPVPTMSPSASEAASSDAIEKESRSTLPEQPVAAGPPSWSVAVSVDPYPSIRMPQYVNSQKPSGTTSLQIGRSISRLEPVYPEEAKHQGIVGTVKLHVVVARDGSVQSVEPISGPSSLAKAAISAVREWRYAPTLLGGQPVETEQDIVVKFRMAGPSTSQN
jgi:TonB family protein